ncbi:Lrp/AsnC family transcriptional regulator [Rhodococcus sp. NPDC127530]|uniref:Lrp/AsnC family transcriptional regulator n=1 Tax=unclassified Rhodococcus (in: high G+C Gram-positive bacteria) TaxID=192944 RepID=UPI003635E3D7
MNEPDLKLVECLQLAPRAPWTLVADVLGMSPVTVARRWEELESAGIVWVRGFIRSSPEEPVVRAWVEIDTGGLAAPQLEHSLAGHPDVIGLRRTSGVRDYLALVVAHGLDALADFAGGVAGLDQCRSIRMHLVTHALAIGSTWSLNVLDAAQRRRLPSTRFDRASTPIRPHAIDRGLFAALERDGRASFQTLAEELDTSAATVKRRIQALERAGRLEFRCGAARTDIGYPVSAIYFGSVPANQVERVSVSLNSIPGLRMASVTAGPFNLVLDVWLQSLEEVHRLETRITGRLAEFGVTISDRAVVLHTVKHMGRLLDSSGRAIAHLPVSPEP